LSIKNNHTYPKPKEVTFCAASRGWITKEIKEQSGMICAILVAAKECEQHSCSHDQQNRNGKQIIQAIFGENQ
jgi:hypothetical protein